MLNNYELVQYTVNPTADKPAVYIGLYLTADDRRSKAEMTSEQLINSGKAQSRPSGNQTRVDIAFGQASEIIAERIGFLESVSQETANIEKSKRVSEVDTAKYELLNSKTGGAKGMKALLKDIEQAQWDYYRDNKETCGIKNPSRFIKAAIVNLMLEGVPVEDAFAEIANDPTLNS